MMNRDRKDNPRSEGLAKTWPIQRGLHIVSGLHAALISTFAAA